MSEIAITEDQKQQFDAIEEAFKLGNLKDATTPDRK